MNTQKIFQPVVLLGLATIILFGVVACEAADQALIQSLAEEWAKSKHIHPGTPEGIINITGRAFGVSTGDEQADAAIDAYAVIEKIRAADKLLSDGVNNNDPKKIDQAIDMRPGDFVYRNTRAAMNAGANNWNAAEQDYAKADDLAKAKGGSAQELNLRSRLNLLRPKVQSRNAGTPTQLMNIYCKNARDYSSLTKDSQYERDGC
jgi:hypothetical protein